MKKSISQLDFSSASAVIESNTVFQMFSSIKRNHFIVLSAKDIQWHIVITTWKPQQLQWINSLHVCISMKWLVYYCRVVLLLCTFCLPVIYFPMQRRFPNLQKQKVLFDVRFDMRAIWETIKDVSSMLREHKLVSSATCKIFSMDRYFEREWGHFLLFFPWFWSIWRLWRKTRSFSLFWSCSFCQFH